jgi:hypothetical protein
MACAPGNAMQHRRAGLSQQTKERTSCNAVLRSLSYESYLKSDVALSYTSHGVRGA